MALKQYIGARYVTKIYENSLDPSQAEWEANVNYEPLTLVTYNYGSYLSKKEVPANIGEPANNPLYWVQTGFYNGQIASLQDQINFLNSMVTDEKILLVYDSYGTNTPQYQGWRDYVMTKMGLTYGVNEFDGRTGYCGGGFADDSYYGELVTVMNDFATDADRITKICVFGGYNDIDDTAADIETGFAKFVNYAKTNFPNAKITVGYIGGTTYLNNISKIRDTSNLYKKLCSKYSVKYAVNSEYINRLYSLYTNDNIHPNDWDEMSDYIVQCILHDACDILRYQKYTITSFDSGAGANIGGTLALNIYQTNGNLQIMVDHNITDINSIPGGSVLTGLKIADFKPDMWQLGEIVFPSTSRNSVDSWAKYDLALVLMNGELKLRSVEMDSNGYKAMPAAYQIAKMSAEYFSMPCIGS